MKDQSRQKCRIKNVHNIDIFGQSTVEIMSMLWGFRSSTFGKGNLYTGMYTVRTVYSRDGYIFLPANLFWDEHGFSRIHILLKFAKNFEALTVLVVSESI
jgi:hypothetical protein